MLKFEGIPVGTKIRAYCHEPMEGRSDRYVEGVINRVSTERGYNAYEVSVLKDTTFPESHNRVGSLVFVPLEVGFMEYDERVSVL